jgi:hypothetical protein
MNEASAEDYRIFVQNYNVHLVMIYDDWFEGEIPPTWTKVASMNLSRLRISPAESEVQFYATDAKAVDTVHPELVAFSKSLPPRIRMKIYSSDCAMRLETSHDDR